MTTLSPAAPASAAQPYAGAVTRAVAFALDIAILQGLLFLGGLVVALIVEAFSDFSLDVDLQSVGVAALVWAIAFTAYFTSFWSLTGQTPGMRVMRVRVTASSGERLGPRRSLVRIVGMLLAAIPLFAGYFLILVHDRRKGLHDVIARSVVRYVEDDQPFRSPRQSHNLTARKLG
jgi:uncharacterized RDD family membrane protein YckC